MLEAKIIGLSISPWSLSVNYNLTNITDGSTKNFRVELMKPASMEWVTPPTDEQLSRARYIVPASDSSYESSDSGEGKIWLGGRKCVRFQLSMTIRIHALTLDSDTQLADLIPLGK